MANYLLTGAASGIAKAVAERALARGHRIIACDKAAATLPAQERLLALQVDVGSTASVEEAFAQADRWLAGAQLDGVVHCAGFCPPGALELQSMDVIEATMNVNALGSARVLRCALPRLRGHGGRAVLLSSLWGKVSGPLLAAYCGSKYAIEAFADAARRETHGHDLHVILIEPGVVRTPLIATQIAIAKAVASDLPESQKATYGSLYRKYAEVVEKNASGGSSAEEAAAVIERALTDRRPATRYTVGSDSRAVIALGWLLPDRALDGVFRRMFG